MIKVLKAHEAAKMLQISPRTLLRLTNAGLIARIKIRRSVRYKQEDIEEYLRYARQSAFARKENRSL